MVTTSRFIKLLIAFLCISAPVKAAEPLAPLNFSGSYDFSLSSLKFGRLDIDINQQPTHYDASANVQITGIVKFFVEHTSHTTSAGSGTNFAYPNVDYESSYQTRKKPKHVKWQKIDGKFVSEIAEPPDNRETRAAVSTDLKEAAVDPVALALAVRTKLNDALHTGAKNFNIDMYDGRRLTRVSFVVNDERTITLNEKNYDVYRVTASRKPVEGFTQKELARLGKKEPPLTIYFSHDSRLVPIRLEVPMLFGLAAATLRA